MNYSISLIGDDNLWKDSGEGPWDNVPDAVDFAHAEVGVPWLVVTETGRPLAYGDCRGLRWCLPPTLFDAEVPT